MQFNHIPPKLCLYQHKFVICYHKMVAHFDLEKYFKNHKAQKHEVKRAYV